MPSLSLSLGTHLRLSEPNYTAGTGLTKDSIYTETKRTAGF